MALVFFKTNRHKKFNYKPVYYNESKEELKEIQKKASSADDEKLEMMRSKMRKRWQQHRKVKSPKYTTAKIAFILFLLFAIVYYLLR